jgi:hypothetical protein
MRRRYTFRDWKLLLPLAKGGCMSFVFPHTFCCYLKDGLPRSFAHLVSWQMGNFWYIQGNISHRYFSFGSVILKVLIFPVSVFIKWYLDWWYIPTNQFVSLSIQRFIKQSGLHQCSVLYPVSHQSKHNRDTVDIYYRPVNISSLILLAQSLNSFIVFFGHWPSSIKCPNNS